MPITSILASLCALLIILLSANVIKLRGKYKQSVGPIADEEYSRKNGALTNFTTTMPIVLILMAFAETAHFCWAALACIALAYLIARLTHIYSLYYYETKTGRFTLRIIGMATTFIVITILAVINLYLSICALVGRF